ncbi:MAG TPA: hypothetical protein VH105_01000 [Burkholderiales bacterium]|nr:hypothetical protein [Burkholderiales bacterium]
MTRNFLALFALLPQIVLAQLATTDAEATDRHALYVNELRYSRECMHEQIGDALHHGIRDPRRLLAEASPCGKNLQVLVFDNFKRRDLDARIEGIAAYLAWDELRQTPGTRAPPPWRGPRPCVTYACAVAPVPGK